MAQSNRQAVENNKIPDAERFDFAMPRNACKVFDFTVNEVTVDEDTGAISTAPMDLSGNTFVGSVKTSYEAAAEAFAIDFDLDNSDLPNGQIRVIYDATKARNLGIGVVDCVHQVLRVHTDGRPYQVYAGLLEFSKGVAVPAES